MRRALRYLGIALGVVVLIFASLWVYLWAAFTPSNIVDFNPTDFDAKGERAFFYSIGDELKYSDALDPQAPTLLRGKISHFLVSPDTTKIAVVANGHLLVIERENPVVREVASVDSIYREPKPIGQHFYRNDDFQWTRDSQSLYVIRDEYYESKGSQLFSGKGELWKYDLQTGKLDLVLKPFPAYTYFFGPNSAVYYSVPTENGDLQLKYFDGTHVTNIGTPNISSIPLDGLGAKFTESPFFSFSIVDYSKIVFPEKDVDFVSDKQPGRGQLEIGNKPYLTLTRGNGLKGPFYAADTSQSVFLPGDRYFLFNVYCGNYEGPLLIDTATAKYKTLPKKTRVYLTLNTDTNPHYRITSGGMMPN